MVLCVKTVLKPELQGDPDLLRHELQKMLGAEYAEGATADPKMKAVISPHAGACSARGVSFP